MLATINPRTKTIYMRFKFNYEVLMFVRIHARKYLRKRNGGVETMTCVAYANAMAAECFSPPEGEKKIKLAN